MVLYDIQHLGLWLLLMNIFNYHLIIEIFFLASFIASIISISIYLYLSKKIFHQKTMNLIMKNKKKPIHNYLKKVILTMLL